MKYGNKHHDARVALRLIASLIFLITSATALSSSSSSSSNALPNDIRQAILGRATSLPTENESSSVPLDNKNFLYNSYQIHPILSQNDRSRNANVPDEYFYSSPLFVQHNDDIFRDKLAALYSRVFSSVNGDNNDGNNVVFLDLGSSWVSHLPTSSSESTTRPKEVWLHGMNREELERNPDGTGYRIVKSFNDLENDSVNAALLNSSSSSSSIPVSSSSPSNFLLPEIFNEQVDVIGVCAAFQYWQFPERVVGEALRLLKPNTGRIVISFSDRMFESKAIEAWKKCSSSRERIKYVSKVLEKGATLDVDGSRFEVEEVVVEGGMLAYLTSGFSKMVGRRVVGDDPFLAVVARKTSYG